MMDMEACLVTSRDDASVNASAIKNAALTSLARREYTRDELRVKLQRKFLDKGAIEHILDTLTKDNLQSDERFCESYIRFKKNQGKGPRYIKQALKQKGVNDYLIAAYVYEEDESWSALAEEVYTRKFGVPGSSDTDGIDSSEGAVADYLNYSDLDSALDSSPDSSVRPLELDAIQGNSPTGEKCHSAETLPIISAAELAQKNQKEKAKKIRFMVSRGFPMVNILRLIDH
ncbi:MAG: regulatory protein [Lentisphaeria bacterium]